MDAPQVVPNEGAYQEGLQVLSGPPARYDASSYDTVGSPSYSSHEPIKPPAVVHAGQYPPEKKILGMRRPTFLLCAVLIFVIVAAAIGGGVGGSMAVANAKAGSATSLETDTSPSAAPTSETPTSSPSNESTIPSTETSTPSTETSTPAFQADDAPVSVPTNGIVDDFNCQTATRQTNQKAVSIKTWKNQKFDYTFNLTCLTDHRGDSKGIDLMGVTAYSLDDCLRSCASANRLHRKSTGRHGEDVCVAVSFDADLTRSLEKLTANCFLKRFRAPGKYPELDMRSVAAELVLSPDKDWE